MLTPPIDTEVDHADNVPSPMVMLFAFGGLMACLAAGYGVLFTIVDDYRDEYGISETAIGIVIGIGFVAAFLSQLLIAPLADRGHARKVVLFGVAINVIGLLLMGFSTTLTPILIGRFISGLGIGATVPAARRIVILADPNHLGQNLGRLLAADVFGFAMGPAVSAILVGPFGIPAPFIVVAAGTVVLLPFVARVRVAESTTPPPRRLAVDLLQIRPFAGAVVLGAAVFVMIGSFDALWALVHRDLGTAEWIANLGITLFALPLVILGPPAGRWAQVYGPFKVAVFGLCAGACFIGLYGLMPTGGLIFAVAMFHAISDGLTVSSSGVAVGMTVPEERQAGAQGILGGAQALSAGIMAVITAAIYDQFGRTAAYLTCTAIMLTLVATGAWLARSAWSLNRPLHDDTPLDPRPADLIS
ncbi:MAG: MFS transporter [Ilumatobacteraceae bacterium]